MTDPLLILNKKTEGARSEIGVRNRQPQGQLVPFPIAGSGVFDEDDAFDLYIRIPSRIYVLIEVVVELYFKQFFAPAKSAISGGSSSPTTASGGSSTPTTASGGSSSPTSDSAAAHRHQMFDFALAGPIATTIDEHNARDAGGGPVFVYFGNGGNTDLYTWTADGSHSHSVSVPAHDHTVTIGSHQHSVSVPAHGHDLAFGIYKEPMPASINVNVGLWRKPFVGGTWELFGSIGGLNEPEEYFDVTSWFRDDPSGLWRLTFLSAPGQPNGGRLTVDVAHDAFGAIKSA